MVRALPNDSRGVRRVRVYTHRFVWRGMGGAWKHAPYGWLYPPVMRKIDLRAALGGRGMDVAGDVDKAVLVSKALGM